MSASDVASIGVTTPPPTDARSELRALLRDRRLWLGAAPLTVLLVAALNLWASVMHARLLQDQQANLVAPRESIVWGKASTHVRYDLSTGAALGQYWKSIPDARRQPLVILSGMSQNYAINEPRPGDQTIAEWLDDSFAPRGVRVFGLAAPNLDDEEALLLLLAVSEDPATRPRAFVFGACMDKMRLLDIRPSYQTFLRSQPALQRAWLRVAEEYQSRYPLAAEKMRGTIAALASPTATELYAASVKDDRSMEGRIRSAAARVFPLVRERTLMNYRAQSALFALRNWIFHISNASKRPMISSRYALNQQFLQMMMAVARERGIAFAVYVVPLNPQADNPYIPAEYGAFKKWLGDQAQRQGVAYADLDSIVPNEDWGLLNGGPDFKHFKGEGHRITARALEHAFGAVLLGRASP